ncbi:NACHT domain-containing protein [Nonomuraea angiospora]|uniref:NACHT domain-containing protein n=1 Tax=Nonomuraea angiospora TaxID=46172 RepID=UPI0029B8C06C|nr:hypothetical protein [Nonomuraea angiospora]MDX3099297.1 hypothetical protein [Nonomuraea angiospora]
MDKARSRHSLHRELVSLEEQSRERPGRYSRNGLLDDIHDGGNGPRLSPQTVSGWLKQGRVPDDFADLWAFVEALLRRASPGGPQDRHRLVREKNKFKGLWEAARQQAEPGPRPPSASLPSELAEYLNATRLASLEHPYPAVLPGTGLPPLSQVYVRQQAELRPAGEPGKGPDKAAWDRRPAEDIVRGNVPMTWLLGGPGAGKSSLLRMIVVRLAQERLAEDGKRARPRRSAHPGVIHTLSSKDKKPPDKPLFPVYVPAHALMQPGSFTQQLAHVIALQLKGYDYIPPADRFFRDPPLPGAQWLILIDGLDEISDIDERLRVLKTLTANRKGPYRFVIGSRPLPDSELAILDEGIDTGPARETARGGRRGLDEQAGRRHDDDEHSAASGPVGRYELLPLEVSVLPTFVRGWMEAARVPWPAPAVEAFMHQVNSGRLRELVRNPLMATILCQLHAADPTHPLPMGRYAAYQRFYELLCDRFYDPSSTGINHQLHTQLRRYGAQSSAAIDNLPGRLLAALGQAALRRQHERAGAGALEQIRACVADLRPDDMAVSRWDALTAQVLRRTGLVVVKAGDVAFVHQTLGEFLAARHAARESRIGESELLRLSHKNGLRPLSYLTSYDRFLIAAWIAEDRSPPGLGDLLVKLSGSYSSAAGIAELVRDGVDLGAEVREAAADTLRRMASGRDLSKTVVAAEGLASVDVPSAVEVLSIVLKSPAISFVDRARLSKKIIEFDPLRAVDVFAELSMSRRLNIMYRDHASDYLTALDQERAASVIAEMVREREGDADELAVLIKKLANLDRPVAVAMLADALDRHVWTEPHRLKLLKCLTEMEASV